MADRCWCCLEDCAVRSISGSLVVALAVLAWLSPVAVGRDSDPDPEPPQNKVAALLKRLDQKDDRKRREVLNEVLPTL